MQWTPSLEMSKPDLERVGVAQITLQHYESSSSSQYDDTYALWTFKRPLTVFTEKQWQINRENSDADRRETGMSALPSSLPSSPRLGDKRSIWVIR